MADDQIDNSMAVGNGAHVQQVNMPDPVASIRLVPVLTVFIAVSLIAVVASISAILYETIKYKQLWDQYQLLENEYRLQEMYTMELDARLIGKGIIDKDEGYISLRPKLGEAPKGK